MARYVYHRRHRQLAGPRSCERLKQFSARVSKRGDWCSPQLEAAHPFWARRSGSQTGQRFSFPWAWQAKLKVAGSVEEVRSILRGRSLDVLGNCAGAYGETHGDIALTVDLDYQLSVNVIGAHNVLRQCIPLMQNSDAKKVINISSGNESIISAQDYVYAHYPAYKIRHAVGCTCV
ncbi:hypothetical protein BDW68DRAFT_76540 [Aspergillus falconensis]